MESKLATTQLTCILTIILLSVSDLFAQEQLARKNYPFLTNEELKFASENKQAHIANERYTWQEWVIYETGQETKKLQNVEIRYKETAETNKIDGILIFGKDTFQIYGINKSATLWSDGLKGMLYIYPKTGPDEFEYYYDPHIASINLGGKKYKIEIVPGRSSFYEDSEQELISNVSNYKLDNNRGKLTEYKRDTISLKYYIVKTIGKETGQEFEKVNGTLTVGKTNYELFGTIVYGEGGWGYASLWQDGSSKGILQWDVYEDSDSTTIGIKECKDPANIFCDYSGFTLKKETKLTMPNTNGKFGKDQGKKITETVAYNGTASLEKRKIISDIPNGEIESNVNGYIYFKLTVNADGDVIAVINDTKKTTITDAVFIAKMTSLIKEHVKYNKRSTGSAIEQVDYAKKVNAL